MTAFNNEEFIADAINSVLASSFKNFELIVVDDNSFDKSYEIAKLLANKDQRIKVFKNPINQGDYPNRNIAAKYASGKYLKFVDADDYIYPWGLEMLINMMEANPKAGWGLCSLSQDYHMPFPILLNSEQAYKYNYLGPGLFHKAPLSSIIRKEEFFISGGFTGKKYLGDYEFWHIISKMSPVLLMPQGIVWSRTHDKQESRHIRKDVLEPFKYVLLAERMLKSEDCPLLMKDKKVALEKINQRISRLVFRTLIKGELINALKLIKMSKKPIITLFINAF